LIAGSRHIRTAIGRDYADVPPTRGVFKGEARTDSELTVSVKVAPTNTPPPLEPAQVLSSSVATAGLSDLIAMQQSQQQQ
jgi:hypothetical protein